MKLKGEMKERPIGQSVHQQGGKRANKPSPYKRLVALRVNIETCREIEKEFRKPEDKGISTAFIRALEDSVRDVELTPEDYIAIANEIKANREKIRRM